MNEFYYNTNMLIQKTLKSRGFLHSETLLPGM